MRFGATVKLAAGVMGSVAVVACGASAPRRGGETAPAVSSPTATVRPPAGPPPATPSSGKPSAADVAVIRAWSDTLRRGDVSGAAHYFAIPSLLINGAGQGSEPITTAIRSFRDAVAANASLPCGAALISTERHGRYVNALFRLTNRGGLGGGCGSGAGQTARTNFLIRRGHIAEWIRAPSQPGDNGGASV